MRYSVCSYSFHRSFDDGSMDLDGYIAFCRDAGFTELDVWSRHLPTVLADSQEAERVKALADEAGVPFASIAADEGAAWAPTEGERDANREGATAWLDLATRLGATQVRFNSGPFHVAFEPGEGTAEQFDGVVAGFTDLVARGRERGIEVITENHWGPFQHPDDLGRLLDAVPGLGLLFDTHNWPEELQSEAWDRYAGRARMTHFKTFAFSDGDETTQDIPRAVSLVQAGGYDGCWGVESVPDDGDERAAAEQTLALLRRLVEAG
jgi:sugar phosphate isomerase/epimerase